MTEPLLTVVAEMSARAGREDELRSLLTGLLAPTRAEAGCVQYDLHEATATPGRFVFYENWTSAAALEAHLATPHLQRLAALAPELVEGEMRVVTYHRIESAG